MAVGLTKLVVPLDVQTGSSEERFFIDFERQISGMEGKEGKSLERCGDSRANISFKFVLNGKSLCYFINGLNAEKKAFKKFYY